VLPALSLLIGLDAPSLAGATLTGRADRALVVSERSVAAQLDTAPGALDDFQLRRRIRRSAVEARPGNVLGRCEGPASWRTERRPSRGRGRDVDRPSGWSASTSRRSSTAPHRAGEAPLLSEVVALAGRRGRCGCSCAWRRVFDAVVETALRLDRRRFTSAVETLSADDQARLLGDAWERAPHADLDVRLVVHHRAAAPPSIT
jgi:hypothetical protein